ncbi:hypothetical protein D3C87_1852180 [compost metagenome]
MFDQASPFTHGSRPQVHPGLERIDHRFMLPARDLSLDRRRALRLDATACATGPIPVPMQRHASFDDGHVVRKQGADRATVDVLIRQIDEVLLAEAARCLRA